MFLSRGQPYGGPVLLKSSRAHRIKRFSEAALSAGSGKILITAFQLCTNILFASGKGLLCTWAGFEAYAEHIAFCSFTNFLQQTSVITSKPAISNNVGSVEYIGDTPRCTRLKKSAISL